MGIIRMNNEEGVNGGGIFATYPFNEQNWKHIGTFKVEYVNGELTTNLPAVWCRAYLKEECKGRIAPGFYWQHWRAIENVQGGGFGLLMVRVIGMGSEWGVYLFTNRKIETEEELKKDGFRYGFIGHHPTCQDCGHEMMGRIKAYPPYCDSTYEEWHCPACGNGYGMSA